MNFSEAQIEAILEAAELAWAANRIPTNRKREYLLTLKTYLAESGTIENVCPGCLGNRKAGRNIEASSCQDCEQLYCPDCGEYLENGLGELKDCNFCGWQQP